MSTGKRPSYKKLYEEALERIEALEHKLATKALEEASVEDLVTALQSKQAYGDSIEDLAHVEDIMTAAEFLFDCDRGSKKKFLEALRGRLELTFWEHEETRKDLREELNGAECEVRSVRDELREAHDELKKVRNELKEAHDKLKTIARDHVTDGLTQEELIGLAEAGGAICFRDEEHLEDHIDDLGLYGSGNVIKELEYALTAQSESERQDCIDKALYIVKWREY